jgi:hypothetical protein
MAYPQLARKIEILDKKFGIDPTRLAQIIHKDKSTAWRWLSQQSERLRPAQQSELVAAICKVLKAKGVDLTDQVFRGHNPLKFCLDAGLTKLEAAHYNEFNLPIPEIFIDSLFDLSNDPARFNGHYLQYRIEREMETNDPRYMQAYATIWSDEDQLIKYEGTWRGDNTRRSYEGFVFLVGSQVNIVGQCNIGQDSRPEIWWCGIRPTGVDGNGKSKPLSGYMSDTQNGKLCTDRIVLTRCTEEEQSRVRERNEIYVTRNRLIETAGKEMANYLDEWRNVPV